MLAFLPLSAQAFSLAWPLDCELGTTCFIQNYVEHGTGEPPVDFACDGATFHGLTGTDIRIKSLAAMRAGVVVKAASDGIVLGTRDGVADVSIRDGGEVSVKGRECGNGVNIQNAEGYSTQYCHLQKGSLRVHSGQHIKTGDALGLVGLSGETEFPHLHINLTKDGAHIDPFTGAPAAIACDTKFIGTTAQLWATLLPYQPTSLLNDGITSAVPDRTAMLDTPVSLEVIATDAAVVTYWVELLNVRNGDLVSLTLVGPNGSTVAEHATSIGKNMAAYFTYIGKRNSAGAWPKGRYTATITLKRGSDTILMNSRSADLR